MKLLFIGLAALAGASGFSWAQDASKPSSGAAQKTVQSAPTEAGEWKPLFDGKTLAGWKASNFAGHGEVHIEPDFKGGPAILFEIGAALTGLTWTNAVPTNNFEVELEAMLIEGSDFFCGLTFPYQGSHCTLVVGGWGGAVVGLSSVNFQDASENETTKYQTFQKGKWHRIRAKATPEKIEAWINDDKTVDLETSGKKINMRFGEIENSVPLGLAAYQTRSAMRNIRIRQF